MLIHLEKSVPIGKQGSQSKNRVLLELKHLIKLSRQADPKALSPDVFQHQEPRTPGHAAIAPSLATRVQRPLDTRAAPGSV